MEKKPLNRFLKNKEEINQCTNFIRQNNLVEHAIDCKNWDIAMIVPYLSDGNILDMGCIGSHILHNASKLNLLGLKFGIDLLFKPEDIDNSEYSWNNPDNPKVPGCGFYQGDLMNTGFMSELFNYITCLSVIEHSVDFKLLAKECHRLLNKGGKLFITFDYWEPAPNTKEMKLYDLNWNILDKNSVLSLVESCSEAGLHLTSDIDWTIQEAVINPSYCSPSNVSYTFGILMFEKK